MSLVAQSNEYEGGRGGLPLLEIAESLEGVLSEWFIHDKEPSRLFWMNYWLTLKNSIEVAKAKG